MLRRLKILPVFVVAGAISGAVVSAGGSPDNPQVAAPPPATAPQAAAPQFATPAPVAPLFFREGWRQTGAFDASTGFQPERGVTSAAVTNPALELKLYDPAARSVTAFLKSPPPGSIARDWTGPFVSQLSR